jgi:hypothetical protein
VTVATNWGTSRTTGTTGHGTARGTVHGNLDTGSKAVPREVPTPVVPYVWSLERYLTNTATGTTAIHSSGDSSSGSGRGTALVPNRFQ